MLHNAYNFNLIYVFINDYKNYLTGSKVTLPVKNYLTGNLNVFIKICHILHILMDRNNTIHYYNEKLKVHCHSL